MNSERSIKTRHLATFIEIARHSSIGKAADALRVAQPAVTRTLRELEHLLGAALVERDGRGIRLTAAGREFRRHAGASLAAIREGVDAVGRTGTSRTQRLRIGALPTVSVRIMPQAVTRYMADGAAVLKIVTGENAVLLDQLVRGELDLVVGRMAAPERMSGLSFEYLYSEQVVFAVRAGHPLLAEPAFDLAAIASWPVIMPTPTAIIRPFVDRLLLAHGVPHLAAPIESVSDSFGRAFLRSSDAIWIISEGVVAGDVAAGMLAVLPVDTSETRGAVGLTLRADQERPQALDLFMRAVRAAARPA